MRSTALAALAAAVAAIAVPTFAGAAVHKKHSCAVDLTAKIAQVKVNSGSPPANGSDTLAATLDGKVCGKTMHGAGRAVNTYPTPGSFISRGVVFGPLGSVKSKSTGTGKLNPDGSISFSGKGKVTGGTGIYKGATGTFTFTGSRPANSSVSTQHYTGKLKY